MELYVHIPFCRKKCRYCDFASYAGHEQIMPAYVDTLLLEASCRARVLSSQPIETIFIGGGTPSLLPAKELDRLLKGLKALFAFNSQAEFTSEANPGTLTRDWLNTAVFHGVNRLSLGMQALQPELLQTLGRIHDFDQVRASVGMAREAGIRNISIDLMFGLPGQSPAMWHDTLHAALSLAPQHLSCYGLIPEEGTPLTHDLDAGLLTLPDEDDERQMYDDTLAILSQKGFQQYEISNFALPGYACRHNLGYWRQTPYLGLGASASSMLITDHPQLLYQRETNPSDLRGYMNMVKAHMWGKRDVVPVTREEARFETMMLGLRTTQGVSEDAFAAMHSLTLQACYSERLNSLHERGLMTYDNGWWRLTRRGMDVQNAILVELMDE